MCQRPALRFGSEPRGHLRVLGKKIQRPTHGMLRLPVPVKHMVTIRRDCVGVAPCGDWRSLAAMSMDIRSPRKAAPRGDR